MAANNDQYYATTQANAANTYNSMFKGGGGNPNGVYNNTKPLAITSSDKPNQQFVSPDPLFNGAAGAPMYAGTKPALDPYGSVGAGPVNQGFGVPNSFLDFYRNQLMPPQPQTPGMGIGIPGLQRMGGFPGGMYPGTQFPTNYGGQNPNLSRYQPPMMEGRGSSADPSRWMNPGPYAYNVPNSYGVGPGQGLGTFQYPPIWG